MKSFKQLRTQIEEAKGTPADKRAVKKVAQDIAKGVRNHTVTDAGDEFYIHHKDDADGNEHVHVVFAKTGSVDIAYEYGGGSYEQKTLDYSAAVKYGISKLK